MTIQPCPPSFLALCRKRTGTSEKRQEVSSFLPIAGKLETFAPNQATQVETLPPAKQPESLTGREVSKETKQETSWKPAPETMETFAPKNTPKSFQVSSPENQADIDEIISRKIARDDRAFVHFHLARLPDRFRSQALDHYLVTYARAFDNCANQNGRENAGRKAANAWLRTEAQSWK
jgi:hypothetical protein